MTDNVSGHNSSLMSCQEMTSGMVRCDQSAWTVFHEKYFDWLYAKSLLQGNSHGEADDIVQLTCLRAVRHIKVFEHESDLKNWLSCLMRCVVIDHARKVKRRNILIEKFIIWQELNKSTKKQNQSFDSESINRALGSLPSHEAQLIKLKYIDGWSNQELAEKNSTTPKAIESKLARLRKSIRLQLTHLAPPD